MKDYLWKYLVVIYNDKKHEESTFKCFDLKQVDYYVSKFLDDLEVREILVYKLKRSYYRIKCVRMRNFLLR